MAYPSVTAIQYDSAETMRRAAAAIRNRLWKPKKVCLRVDPFEIGRDRGARKSRYRMQEHIYAHWSGGFRVDVTLGYLEGKRIRFNRICQDIETAKMVRDLAVAKLDNSDGDVAKLRASISEAIAEMVRGQAKDGV